MGRTRSEITGGGAGGGSGGTEFDDFSWNLESITDVERIFFAFE